MSSEIVENFLWGKNTFFYKMSFIMRIFAI